MRNKKKIIIFILVIALGFVVFVAYRSALTKPEKPSEAFVKTIQLTEGNREDEMPIFISDGEKIISFSRLRQKQNDYFIVTEGIFMIDANGKNQRQLTRGSIGCYNFFPDKGKILFTPRYPSDNKGISVWETDTNGADAKKLGEAVIPVSFPFKDFYCAFSPNGTKIAFLTENLYSTPESESGGKDRNIWIMNIDGTNLRQLTTGEYVPAFSFSPDSNQIFYSVFNEDIYRSSIWVVNNDGSNQRQITKVPYCPRSLNLNSDGSKLVFAFGIRPQIWVVNTDGTGLKKLSDLKRCGDPLFSPDGKKIAFICSLDIEKETSIWIVDSDGNNLKRLTSKKSIKINSLSFSPQGERIVFSAYEGSVGYHIWMIDMRKE